MTKKIVLLINSLLIVLILYWIRTMKDNDFSPLIFIFCYSILIIINFIVFLVLYFSKNDMKGIFGQVCYGLSLLFIPLLFLVIKIIL